MITLYLALVGLIVGLALDELVVRLAVEHDDDDEVAPGEVEAEEPATEERMSLRAPAVAHGAETGSLVLSRDHSPRAWARRLLIVGATAGLFALAAGRYDDASHLALVTAYVCVLLVCAATDALSFRVPNVITYPAILGALVAGAAMPGADLPAVIAGGALACGVLLLPALFTAGVGMGMGDVKLATFVGLALGFANVAPALLFMALGGGAVALLLLATGLRKRREPIPYAPFISAGALAALLWQGTAFVSLA